MRSPARGVSAFLLVALAASSCSNPEIEKVQHVQRGDQYAADKRDEFAVVEYSAAVQLDPKFGEARFKLAQTHERMGNVRVALPEYVRAADAMPDNRNAQLKATELLLLAAQFENAKARAAALLDKDPKDVDALLLHANALAGLQDTAGAVSRIEEALKVSPESSRAFTMLGAVRVQTGQVKEAEVAFRQALTLDSASVNARLAFADFLSASGRVPEAEAAIKEGLAKEPRNLLANRMLAALYVATQRTQEAEQPLRTVAEISNAPAARFQLADYYVRVGRTKEATDLLTALLTCRLSSDQSFLENSALGARS